LYGTAVPDVGQGVLRQDDQVGCFAGCEKTKGIDAQENGPVPGRSSQCLSGGKARAYQELQLAMRAGAGCEQRARRISPNRNAATMGREQPQK
jgi:hypothetical protein